MIMKRFLIFAIALLVACSAEEDEMNLVKPKSPVRFSAEVEGFGSRTQLDAQGLTCWNADDRITIYTGETYNREFAFDGEDGAPSGGYDQVSIDKTFYSAYDVDANYAIYPHQASNQLKPYSTSDPSQGGYFVATLPAEQAYAKNSFGRGAFTMVAVTQNVSDGRLIFKNIGGCIVLNLYGADQPIVRVTVEGNNSEKLAGKANIAHKNGGLPTTTMQSTATTSVSVVNDEGILLGTTPETATEFWLAVPPTTFEQGFTITVEGADGTTYTKSTSKKQSVERNIFLMMPAIEVDFWGEGSSALITENQKLLYTTTDDNPLSFSEGYTMGEATLVAHTYTDGVGEMIFDKEITTIAGYMFYSNETLQTITLPSTLKEIEMLAFWRCSNLQNITLPEGLETLGMGAFTGCESITEVAIPESVTSVGDNEFRNCASLAKFKGKYASEDGRCLIIDGVLNSFAPADLTTYAIPEGVVRVGEDSFNGCANLTSVTIPEGVEELGNWVFWQCTALASIEIPASVTQIGQQCFGGCTLLSEIYCNPTTPPALELFDGSWRAFEEIAEDAKIYVPAESVEAYKAADGWSDYADMIFADPRVIYYTSTDGEIVEPNNTGVFGANIVSNTYENGQGVIIFDGPVIEIGEEAFEGCSTLTSITIPNRVASIGDYAFNDCTGLTNITIPDGVMSMGEGAFYVCDALTSVVLPKTLTIIPYDLFYECSSLTEVVIPEEVTEIGAQAFAFCTKLSSINIPKSVAKIGNEAFGECSNLKSVYISDLNAWSEIDFEGFGSSPITTMNATIYLNGEKITEVVIPEGTTEIKPYTFYGFFDLERVSIPEGVTTIGDSAFYFCHGLKEVHIPDSVTRIEYAAFIDCPLSTITIPAGVTYIGALAFGHNYVLTTLYCKATTPPTIGGDIGFIDVYSEEYTFYVPASDDDSIINAYKEADGWKDYADQMVEYEFSE